MGEGSCGFLRDLYSNKEVRRIEIIFSGFINDPNLAVRFALEVRNVLVYLAYFQRGRIFMVAHAKNVSFFS
jgi:hypothetical protein